MKKVLAKLFLPLLMFSLCSYTLIGCGSKVPVPEISDNKEPNNNNNSKNNNNTTQSSSSKTFKDDKGTCSIVVPNSKWIKMSSDLNPAASLIIANVSKEEYVAIIAESKDGFPDIDDITIYRDAVLSLMTKNLPDATATNGTAVTIDGKRAVQFELTGTLSNGYKVTYLITVIEGENNVYQILSWTTDTNINNSRSTFIDIANSFKES